MTFPQLLLDLANYKDEEIVQDSLHLLNRFFSKDPKFINTGTITNYNTIRNEGIIGNYSQIINYKSINTSLGNLYSYGEGSVNNIDAGIVTYPTTILKTEELPLEEITSNLTIDVSANITIDGSLTIKPRTDMNPVTTAIPFSSISDSSFDANTSTLNVANGSKFIEGSHIKIDYEVLKVTNVYTNIITVTRAIASTKASGHSVNTPVYPRWEMERRRYIVIENNGTLEINGILEISENTIFINNGLLKITGSITNNGKVINTSQKFINTGTITNYNTIRNEGIIGNYSQIINYKSINTVLGKLYSYGEGRVNNIDAGIVTYPTTISKTEELPEEEIASNLTIDVGATVTIDGSLTIKHKTKDVTSGNFAADSPTLTVRGGNALVADDGGVFSTKFQQDDYIKIGNEVLKVVSVDTSDLTVTRAVAGTGELHRDGAEVYLLTALENNGTLEINGILEISENTIFINNGLLKITGSITNNGTVINTSQKFINTGTITNYNTIRNEGIIGNYSQIINYKSINTSLGKLYSYGEGRVNNIDAGIVTYPTTISKTEELPKEEITSDLTINVGATVTIDDSLTINSSVTLTNKGILEINGILEISSSGSFVNNGFLKLTGSIINRGTFTNNASHKFINTGAITNYTTTFTNKGSICNYSLITNYGSIDTSLGNFYSYGEGNIINIETGSVSYRTLITKTEELPQDELLYDLTISTKAVISFDGSLTIKSGATLTNKGVLELTGMLDILNNCTFVNEGICKCDGIINNYGTIKNEKLASTTGVLVIRGSGSSTLYVEGENITTKFAIGDHVYKSDRSLVGILTGVFAATAASSSPTVAAVDAKLIFSADTPGSTATSYELHSFAAPTLDTEFINNGKIYNSRYGTIINTSTIINRGNIENLGKGIAGIFSDGRTDVTGEASANKGEIINKEDGIISNDGQMIPTYTANEVPKIEIGSSTSLSVVRTIQDNLDITNTEGLDWTSVSKIIVNGDISITNDTDRLVIPANKELHHYGSLGGKGQLSGEGTYHFFGKVV